MRSLKKEFIVTLLNECRRNDIQPEVWDMKTDTIDWNSIKSHLDETSLLSFIVDTFDRLLNYLGSGTSIDTYHESVGYICERGVVYYLISEYNVPDSDDVLCRIHFFIKDGHFDEVSFIPFKYLIYPYFDDNVDTLREEKFDLFYLLIDKWANFESLKGVDVNELPITEDNFNEFLETL